MQLSTAKPSTPKLLKAKPSTMKPSTSKLSAPEPVKVKLSTANPSTMKLPTPKHSVTNPSTMKFPTPKHSTTKPLTMKLPKQKHSTTKPLTMKLPTPKHSTTKPLTVKLPTPKHSTIKPLTMKLPTPKHSTTKPLTVKLSTQKHSTTKPLTMKLPTPKHSTTKPLTMKLPTPKHSTIKPLTMKLPTPKHSTIKPLTMKLPTPKHSPTKPLTMKLPTPKHSTTKPLTMKIPTPKHSTTKPLTVKLPTPKHLTTNPMTMKPSTASPSTAKPSTIKLSTTRLSTLKASTAKTSTSMPSTMKHSTVKSSPTKPISYSTIKTSTEKPGMLQEDLDYIGDYVKARIGVFDNLHKQGNFMTLQLNLTNTNARTVQTGPWKLYLFSLYGFKPEELPCGLRVGHVNGDLYFVTPSEISPFKGINPGSTLTCILHNEWWSVSRTDQMPNWFVSAKGLKPRVLANTADESLSFVGKIDTPSQWKRTMEDKYNPMNNTERYLMHKTDEQVESLWRIVPPLKSQIVIHTGEVLLQADQGWKVLKSSKFNFEVKFIAEYFKLPLTQTQGAGKRIQIIYRKQSDKEAYDLDISSNSVTIFAADGQGALHGVQTLTSLAATKPDGKISTMKISDRPRFSYRGLMLDVARNFKPVTWIKKMLDVMSMYKLNKLHLHLTDNEGWRVEIPELPELTQVGGKRCHTEDTNACVIPARGSGPFSNNTGSGYYTVQDYRDILKYAADRHIDVIPEVDTPGHLSAAITAMFRRDMKIAESRAAGETNLPESFVLTDVDLTDTVETIHKFRANAINPCMSTPYAFMEKVANGFKALHSGVMPLRILNIGGDEVAEGAWNHSKQCNNMATTDGYKSTHALKQLFVKRVAAMLSSKNLSTAAWEDGIYGEGRPNPITDYKTTPVYVYSWNNRWGLDTAGRATEFADEGYKVILNHATHMYFDHPYEPDPEERGLYWATRYIDTRKAFSYMPDNITNNADVDRMGQPVNVMKLCHNKPCPKTKKPENIIGMQVSMFSDVIRTEEQMHYMLFPRLLAFAERAWSKASWEDIDDKQSRDSKMEADWMRFKNVLGQRELSRLEQMGIKYRVPPPGGIFMDGKLRVNTMYANHHVDYSTDNGQTWDRFKHPDGVINIHYNISSLLLRSKSQMNRLSRPIEVEHQTSGRTRQTSAATPLTANIFTLFVIIGCSFISRDLLFIV